MPTVRVFHVVKPLPRLGSGSNPNPELFQRVGTVANTSRDRARLDEYLDAVDGRPTGC